MRIACVIVLATVAIAAVAAQEQNAREAMLARAKALAVSLACRSLTRRSPLPSMLAVNTSGGAS